MMPVRLRRLAVLSLAVAVGCEDLPEDPVLTVDATARLVGLAYLDANGDGRQDAQDAPVRDVGLELRQAGSSASVATARTDSLGRFVFAGVPVGRYSLGLRGDVLGDSLEILTFDAGPYVLAADDTVDVTVGLTYPTRTIEEVRELPPGRPVFTTGIALNSRLPFGDGTVHLKGDSLYLRAIGVERSTLNVGDSVRFFGRTARRVGQPVLEQVTPRVLVSLAALPRPLEVTAAQAASAGEGRLDAALVRVRTLEIADTTTDAGGRFRMVLSGDGTVTVVFRDYITVPRPLFDGDSVRVAAAAGLLVPETRGDEVVWVIQPRSLDDIALELKEPEEPAAAAAGPDGPHRTSLR